MRFSLEASPLQTSVTVPKYNTNKKNKLGSNVNIFVCCVNIAKMLKSNANRCMLVAIEKNKSELTIWLHRYELPRRGVCVCVCLNTTYTTNNRGFDSHVFVCVTAIVSPQALLESAA